jgi:hypothetical protein
MRRLGREVGNDLAWRDASGCIAEQVRRRRLLYTEEVSLAPDQQLPVEGNG